MLRDKFTCQMCGAKASDGTTLNVHHLRYHRGAQPWEYDDKELLTLCESCHKKEHDRIREVAYNVHIGDVVLYEHSDYCNWGVIFEVDFSSMTAMMASVDDGDSDNALWFDELKIYDDGSLRSGRRSVLREQEYSFDWEYGFFYACLAVNLAEIKEKAKKDYHLFFRGNDVDTNVKKLQRNYNIILKNNHQMKEFIDDYLSNK